MNRFQIFAAAVLSGVLPVAQCALAADVDVPSYEPRAQPAPSASGVYIGLRGGVNVMNDTNIASGTRVTTSTVNYPGVFNPLLQAFTIPPAVYSQTTSTTSNFTESYKAGVAFSGQVGFDFGEFYTGFGARAEGEIGYFQNKVNASTQIANVSNVYTLLSQTGTAPANSSQIGAVSSVAGSGQTNVIYGLANYYIDILLGRFKPFIGAGIGLANVDFDNHAANGVSFINSSRTGWAYQVGGGMGFDVTQNITIEAGYRYLVVRDLPLTSTLGARNKIDIRNQQALLGMRFRF